MENYDSVAFITCWHCLEFLIMNEKISKVFFQNNVILYHVIINVQNMYITFSFQFFHVFQEFQMLVLSLITAVAVIVKKFYKKEPYFHWNQYFLTGIG